MKAVRPARVTRLVAVLAIAGCTRGAPGAPGARSEAACGDDSTVVEGACVPYRLASAFCGPAATPNPSGGCVRKACGQGEALDLDHGICLPKATVTLKLLHGQAAEPDDKREPTCLTGTLTTRRAKLDCAAGPLSCGRGERFVKKAPDAGPIDGKCEPLPPCGPGEMFDDAVSKCVAVARTRGGNVVVDVGTWARLALGADGGPGANAFCAPVRTAGPVTGRFQVQLTVPDNDVTQASARLVAKPPVATAEADAAERSLEELVRILHFYGGTSLAASVSAEVTCPPASQSMPTLEVPR